MSLLWMEYEAEFEHLVEKAYERESTLKADYFGSLSERVHKIIYRDTRYNIDYLYTAYVLQDARIMTNYAVWLYELMAGILRERLTPQETADYVIFHLEAIRQSVPDAVAIEKQATLMALLESAKTAIRDYVAHRDETHPHESKYEQQIKEYMDSLFARDSRRSMAIIGKFRQAGIPLQDIYVDILSESMRRVGDLWHTAKITVDVEHYCTSTTQMAMTQLYPEIFAARPTGKTVLCACPGAELHEMGARIVADIFASDGWDSIFLGAAVPAEYIVASVAENEPDLLTLSVSMPQHLIDCLQVVEQVRERFPQVKIAVGGKAFEETSGIWKTWPVDLYTKDARDLLKRANELCG